MFRLSRYLLFSLVFYFLLSPSSSNPCVHPSLPLPLYPYLLHSCFSPLSSLSLTVFSLLTLAFTTSYLIFTCTLSSSSPVPSLIHLFLSSSSANPHHPSIPRWSHDRGHEGGPTCHLVEGHVLSLRQEVPSCHSLQEWGRLYQHAGENRCTGRGWGKYVKYVEGVNLGRYVKGTCEGV